LGDDGSTQFLVRLDTLNLKNWQQLRVKLSIDTYSRHGSQLFAFGEDSILIFGKRDHSIVKLNTGEEMVVVI
jgi:hypothetical protein